MGHAKEGHAKGRRMKRKGRDINKGSERRMGKIRKEGVEGGEGCIPILTFSIANDF